MIVSLLPGWGLLRRLARVLLLAALMALSGQARSAQLVVVLGDDSTPYQEIYQIIRAHLDGSGHSVSRVYAKNLTAASVNEMRLVVVVVVGVQAAEAMAALPNQQLPTLAVLVPHTWYARVGRARLSNAGQDSVSAIYLDQPFARQAQLIRLAFPEARRVGVLLGNEDKNQLRELQDAMRSQRLDLVYAQLTDETRMIAQLETVLSEADLLLALPDVQFMNRNTAQSVFLTSYRYRDPVLGYSRSLTRAGALLSLHSSPAQIGRQAAEWIGRALAASPLRWPAPAYPEYFSVSVNEQVARSLGFELPSASALEKRLGGDR